MTTTTGKTVVLCMFDGPQVIATPVPDAGDNPSDIYIGNAVVAVHGRTEVKWPYVMFRVSKENAKKFRDGVLDLRRLELLATEVQVFDLNKNEFCGVIPLHEDYLPDDGLLAEDMTDLDALKPLLE